MIVYCNFKPQSSTLPATWKCSQCGFTTHKKLQRPPSRRCESRDGKQDTQRRVLDYLACRQRGNVIATVNAATAGCGCSSTSADVYHCRHFNEPVLKRAAARCLEKIAAKVPGYTGRTCRDCKLPTKETDTKEQKNQPETRQETSRPLTTGQTASMRFWDAADSFSTREQSGSTLSSETGSITRDTTAATGRGCGNESTTG